MSEAPPRSAREVLERGRAFLAQKGVEGARLEAELLVAHALGLDRLKLFLELERPVAKEELDRARELLVRRGKGEPGAYLIGSREFYGRPFAVSPAVLIPRPETELLVDVARERAGDEPHIGELGTGSGCLAITLALEIPGARVVAGDISAAALAVARANAVALGATVELLEGDGLEPLRAHAPFDWIVSNPPYVTPESATTLAPEVRDHEPHRALFAPAGDPDHWVHRLAEEGLELVRAGGGVLVELGFDQGARVAAWLNERGLEHRLHRDFQGHERVLELVR